MNPAPTIMIVDDTPASVLLLVRILTQRGYNTKPVLSGKLALASARTEPPDLILLDINMPEMDGYELCTQLKADPALCAIPVIFISSRIDTIDKVKAFQVGGVDYVTKPFQFAEVYARVETHLHLRDLRRQLSTQNAQLECVVAERTRELANACERLLEASQLKDNFLRMISHELRTPTNGVLGVCALILELCPDSAERTTYGHLFDLGSARLCNLIEDATLIVGLEKLILASAPIISFSALLDQVRAALPEITISLAPTLAADSFLLKGHPPLLKRAFASLIRLATIFSLDPQTAQLTGEVEARGLRIRLAVDALSLSSEQVASFFEVESNVRSASAAEALGLAPVVARQILVAVGGELQLVKGEGSNGYFEALLPRELNHA